MYFVILKAMFGAVQRTAWVKQDTRIQKNAVVLNLT